jgi:hypothetical protein
LQERIGKIEGSCQQERLEKVPFKEHKKKVVAVESKNELQKSCSNAKYVQERINKLGDNAHSQDVSSDADGYMPKKSPMHLPGHTPGHTPSHKAVKKSSSNPVMRNGSTGSSSPVKLRHTRTGSSFDSPPSTRAIPTIQTIRASRDDLDLELYQPQRDSDAHQSMKVLDFAKKLDLGSELPSVGGRGRRKRRSSGEEVLLRGVRGSSEDVRSSDGVS